MKRTTKFLFGCAATFLLATGCGLAPVETTTPEEKIQQAYDSLVYQGLTDGVIADFDLITSVADLEDVNITYTAAADQDYLKISEDGTKALITRPKYADGDKYLTPGFTATLSLDDLSKTKSFGVKILKQSTIVTAKEFLAITETSEDVYGLYGQVVVEGDGAVLVGDSTGLVYVYSNDVAKAVEVGDYVLVEGGKTAYNDVNQFAYNAEAGAATVTKLEEKDVKDSYKFTAPEAELWTSERLDEYINKENPTVSDLQGFHVTVQGQLSLSAKSSGKGYYYNIAFEGAERAKGSIAYPNAELAEQLQALDGKMISATGYTLYKSGTVYVNIFAESVNELNLTEQEKANIAANSLKVSSTVSEDFTLTATGTYNSTITWTSSNPAAIAIGEKTEAGYPATVTRTSEDVEVKLTARATVGASSAEKEFTVTVASLTARTWSTIEEVYAMTEGTVKVRGYYQGHNNKTSTYNEVEQYNSVFIADGEKWLQVYQGASSYWSNIAVGDAVEVTGTIAHYSKDGGTTYEVKPTAVEKITDTEGLTNPVWLTVNATNTPAIGQANVNQGAHVSDAVVVSTSANNYGNLTIEFTVGTTPYTLYLDSRYTDVTVDALANLKAGDTFSCDTFVGLKGTTGQFIYANNFTVTSTGTTTPDPEPENPTDSNVLTAQLIVDATGYITSEDTDYASNCGLDSDLFSVKFEKNSCTNSNNGNAIARLNNGTLQLYGGNNNDGTSMVVTVKHPEGKTLTIVSVVVNCTTDKGYSVNDSDIITAKGETTFEVNSTTGFELQARATSQSKFGTIKINYTVA